MKKLFLMLVLVCFSVSAYAGPAVTIDPAHLTFTLFSFFGAGVLLAFTPCVLPMIPILSGILIGHEKISTWRSLQLSLVFVLGMAITYALAGVAAGFLGSTIQTSLQLPWVIITFSFIFIVMALSMFGLFEFKMPNVMVNRVVKMNDNLKSSTLLGVALMGVLSTLIASPCVTAPMISILTYIGQAGNPMLGGLILFVLALGMGVPLVIFAIGQGTLLPKTGIWMVKIKNLFGIFMLGFAIWMLSRLIPNDITMLLFSALFIISAIFFGAFSFEQKHAASRIVQGLSFFALLYGTLLMVGATSGHDDLLQPLKAPVHESSQILPVTQLFSPVTSLKVLEQKLMQAKALHKPVMIDFFAAWCPDCRALDKNVFLNRDVQDLMKTFEVIRIDITENNEELVALRKRYHIYGIPSIVFYDKQGNELQQDATQELNRTFIKQKLIELS